MVSKVLYTFFATSVVGTLTPAKATNESQPLTLTGMQQVQPQKLLSKLRGLSDLLLNESETFYVLLAINLNEFIGGLQC